MSYSKTLGYGCGSLPMSFKKVSNLCKVWIPKSQDLKLLYIEIQSLFMTIMPTSCVTSTYSTWVRIRSRHMHIVMQDNHESRPQGGYVFTYFFAYLLSSPPCTFREVGPHYMLKFIRTINAFVNPCVQNIHIRFPISARLATVLFHDIQVARTHVYFIDSL